MNSYRARHGRRRACRGPKLLEVGTLGVTWVKVENVMGPCKTRCPVRQLGCHRAVCSWGRVANRDSPIIVMVIWEGANARTEGIASGLAAGKADNHKQTPPARRPGGIICFAGVAMPSCCNTRREVKQGSGRYLKTTSSRLIRGRVWLPLD